MRLRRRGDDAARTSRLREPLAPWLLPAAVATAGLAVVWFGHLRLGGYVLAAAFGVGAVLRALLPTARAGALAVRGRALDIVLWVGLAVVVAVGAHSVNIPPPGV